MSSRREFCQALTGATALALLPDTGAADVPASPAGGPPAPYVDVESLLDRQRAFLDLRFGMFVHFNMATYQDREWGDPTGPAAAFDPDALDCDQWAAAAASAGMRYACLTTKHHDGFCIWPTRTAVASVRDTPRRVDVVRAYVDAFRKRGLTVGLYYSILDLRNDVRHHNVTPAKVELIKAQLTELLSDYGRIDLLIFDGWDAPWSRITYGEVPFAEVYALVKRLQPQCLISELNASQYPPSALFYSDVKAFEQNAGQRISGQSDIPAQSCVTLTDGWFWKTGDEHAALKPAETVVHDWLLPQNRIHCNLICNAPPDRRGRLADNVVARLAEIGRLFKPEAGVPPVGPSTVLTTPNLARGRPVHASGSPDTVGPDLANDGSFSTSWYPPDGQAEAWLTVDLPASTAFTTLVLSEPVGAWPDYPASRIVRYAFDASNDGGRTWRDLAAGTDPRPVRIHTVQRTAATAVRLRVWAAGGGAPQPHVSEVGVYDEPARVVRRV